MKIFTEQHEMFRQAVRAFVDREVAPHIEEWEQAGEIPKAIWPRMGGLGFIGVEYDEKYGGGGADFLTTADAVPITRGAVPTLDRCVVVGQGREGHWVNLLRHTSLRAPWQPSSSTH